MASKKEHVDSSALRGFPGANPHEILPNYNMSFCASLSQVINCPAKDGLTTVSLIVDCRRHGMYLVAIQEVVNRLQHFD